MASSNTDNRFKSDTNPLTNERAENKGGENDSQSDARIQDSSPKYSKEQLRAVKQIQSCRSHYEVLRVDKDCTDEDLKKAYKKLALKFHPDKNQAPGATDAFKAIVNAQAVLSDPVQRRSYDLTSAGSETQQSTAAARPSAATRPSAAATSGKRKKQPSRYENYDFRTDLDDIDISFASEFFRQFFASFHDETNAPHGTFENNYERYHRTHPSFHPSSNTDTSWSSSRRFTNTSSQSTTQHPGMSFNQSSTNNAESSSRDKSSYDWSKSSSCDASSSCHWSKQSSPDSKSGYDWSKASSHDRNSGYDWFKQKTESRRTNPRHQTSAYSSILDISPVIFLLTLFVLSVSLVKDC